MGQIESEKTGVICPWIWKNCRIWLCLHSSIYKYWPISTKLGQNVCDYKTPDEFYYGSNQTRTLWVIYPWIRNFSILDFVYTLASANIDQSLPNLATIYMLTKFRFWESDFVYTLASTNNDQSAPNLVKMYVTIRLQMSLIMDLIGPELYELVSTNNDQSAPNLVKMYVTIRLQMSLIMDLIGPELYELLPLN